MNYANVAIIMMIITLVLTLYFTILAIYDADEDMPGLLGGRSANELKRTTRNKTQDVEYPTWGRKDRE